MANMQVILREDVENLGKSGDLVTVRLGYGRNFLLPRQLAVAATKDNVARIEHEKRLIEKRSAKQRAEAEKAAESLKGVEVHIERAVGEGDKLFGSVSSRDIAEALAKKGHPVDHRKIQMPEGQPLKTIGLHTIEIKLDRGVVGQVRVLVVGKPA
jgi:large subunit ribosomal protein L9